MNRATIKWVIIASIVALVGVVVNQFFWIKKDFEIQKDLVEIQKKNITIEQQQFDNKVTLALFNVRDNLLSLNKDADQIYLEPVKKITENYFVVSFYKQIQPKVLESFLLEEFEQQNITHSFEYGVYDCFTDSIIFDKYVDLSNKIVTERESKTRQQKWDHDGYYFGVYFPEKSESISEMTSFVSNSFITSSFIMLLVISIFGYAITVILRQKRLSEVKTDFINNMTHELKTPISTIALSSDFLARTNENSDFEKIRHYAHIIKTENKRLENQVERVLQLAKLDKDQLELKRSEVDLKELIYDVIESFKLSVEQRNGKINISFEGDSFKAYVDRVHFTNVIYNLLDNANKYSPQKPIIEINLKLENQLIIEVKDQGEGMFLADTKQIFEKFYRVNTTDVHDVKGFGLGLFYVKTIIEAHGGTIRVKSELNEGSTFIIKLPLI